MKEVDGTTLCQLASAGGREQNFIGPSEAGQRRIDLVEWVGICRACGTEPEAEIAKLVRKIGGLVPAARKRRTS